jgi:transcriptional regulator with XRE-family HTH domain
VGSPVGWRPRWWLLHGLSDRLLAGFRAAPTRHGLYDLDLFAGTGVLDKMADVDDALAAAAGIGKNTVNRLERDLTEPRPPTLRKLAQALGVDPAELVESL